MFGIWTLPSVPMYLNIKLYYYSFHPLGNKRMPALSAKSWSSSLSGKKKKKAAESQPVMVLDVTVTSGLNQVFTVVELRKVFQVTLEFSLTQELCPFGVN